MEALRRVVFWCRARKRVRRAVGEGGEGRGGAVRGALTSRVSQSMGVEGGGVGWLWCVGWVGLGGGGECKGRRGPPALARMKSITSGRAGPGGVARTLARPRPTTS